MVEEQGYLAFMVRLWTVNDNGEYRWRASVEDAHTGERHAFADVADLFCFLRIAIDRPIAGHVRVGRGQLDDDS